MPWTVTFIAEPGIVETTYAGRITPEELHDAVTATLALASERKTNRYLGDCTGMERGGSASDTYVPVSTRRFPLTGFQRKPSFFQQQKMRKGT